MLFYSNPQPMLIYDRETLAILDVNDTGLSISGYSRSEFLKMTLKDLLSQLDVERLMAVVTSDRLPFQRAGEWRLKLKSGKFINVDISSHILEFNGHNAVIAVAYDVTNRLKAEENLRRQEQILRLFVENSPAAVAMFDREMRYIIASRRYLADYRLGDRDVMGLSHYEVFPEIPERWKEIHRRCLSGSVEKSEEDMFPRMDGSVDWVKWEIRPWYEEAGQIGGVILFSEVITDRKRESGELEVSRLRLLGLINSAMDGIISLDENQKITLFNQAAEKMFGVTAEEMLGNSVDRLIPASLRAAHSGQISKFATTGMSDKSRRMMGMRIIYGVRANGEEFPLEASISQVEVAGKKIFTVILHDVTEQVGARNQLRESEEKYRTIYENSTIGIYRTTPDGRILLANPALVQMLGYSSFEELAARDLQRTGFEPSYARSEFIEAIEKKGEIRGWESAWTKTDGTAIYVRESARVVRDASGVTLYYDGVVEDITQSKEAEEEIHRLNRVYAVLSDINQAIVRATDKQRLFDEACRVAVEVGKFKLAWIGVIDEERQLVVPIARSGVADDFVDGASISVAVEYPQSRGPLITAMHEGRPAVLNDVNMVAPTFSWRAGLLKLGLLSTAAFPLKKFGRVFGAMLFYSIEKGFFDVQEVALLQELSSDISYAVENLEREEQRKSLQAQLVQAQKLESLGTLAGGIAHDFNNILGIIMGYSTFLDAKDPPPEKISRSVNAIKKATDRGAGLVKQLLAFARKEESAFQRVGINEVVNEITKIVKETFPRTINIETDLAPELPQVDADATQLHQVLLNLCVNARDAMPNGGNLRISTGRPNRNSVTPRLKGARLDNYLLLTVSDTGTGIDEQTMRRIFDPFFTTKEVGKGTGLGLALVHSIVSNHNGVIDVESEPGKGTTFAIYLPIGDGRDEVIPRQELPAQDVIGGSETILLLEDEEMLCELVKAVLTSKGYNVLTARDGEEGIELFEKERGKIKAVISDLGLPGLPGDEVLKRIRAIDPVVRLIAASGYIEPAAKSKLDEIRVEHFVHKPYSPSDILQTLRSILDTK